MKCCLAFKFHSYVTGSRIS